MYRIIKAYFQIDKILHSNVMNLLDYAEYFKERSQVFQLISLNYAKIIKIKK